MSHSGLSLDFNAASFATAWADKTAESKAIRPSLQHEGGYQVNAGSLALPKRFGSTVETILCLGQQMIEFLFTKLQYLVDFRLYHWKLAALQL